jgi:hypothetical protein
MEFLLLIETRRDEGPRAAVGTEEVGKFARELEAEGVLRAGAGPLAPESQAARIRKRGGPPVVTDGPFAEGREVVGGIFVVEARDRAAAIELAKRCPWARAGVIEVRAIARDPERNAETGAPRFVVFYLHGGGPPDPERLAQGIARMRAYTEGLIRAGTFLTGGRLPHDTPPAFVEVRESRTLVTDGPFAEAKEVIGGIALIQAASRAEAIEIASRAPAAEWGTVEVREVTPRA